MRVYLLCMVCLESIFWLRRHHPFQCPLVPRVGEKFLSSLRVILYMGSPQIFNFWGERKQQSPNDISVIHCDLLAERESTTKTTHSTSILRLVAQHLLLQMHSMSITPECYSGILVKNTPSFRKGLGVGYICRFLRFSFSFTPLIPCLLPPREEREKTERTTAQLPANKKC